MVRFMSPHRVMEIKIKIKHLKKLRKTPIMINIPNKVF